MNNSNKQCANQEKEQQKMNMILNNLEQQLGGSKEFCRNVAKVIDMNVETNALLLHLEQMKTNIDVIEKKRIEVIESCIESCSNIRKEVLAKIYQMNAEINERTKLAKLVRIETAINYCISNYPLYKKSKYSVKYGSGIDGLTKIQQISLEELIYL